MSHLDQSATPRPKIGADKIILGVLAALIVGALLYVSSQRQQQLRSSPTGLDGLQVWLTSQGQTARNFAGGWPLAMDDIGLMILPLYDTALDAARDPARTQKDWIMQQDEYDLNINPILSKIQNVPTLLILPKWRSGMRLTGLAHPLLLAERDKLQGTLDSLLGTDDARLSYGRQPFVTFPYDTSDDTLEATIYAAQMFASDACTPIVGTDSQMILGSCTRADDTEVFVLSDPDLINNHGLALGDNAFIIRDFTTRIAEKKQVIIDYSRINWLTRLAEPEKRERTWSDLKRFFEPPFTLMWVGLGIAVFLILWRAAFRFGPLIEGRSALGASKMMAIGARARLMRLVGRDGALVGDYSTARLAAAASALVGSAHANQISNAPAFLAYTERRHPKHAPALREALDDVAALHQSASVSQAMTVVEHLDRILEQITHDS